MARPTAKGPLITIAAVVVVGLVVLLVNMGTRDPSGLPAAAVTTGPTAADRTDAAPTTAPGTGEAATEDAGPTTVEPVTGGIYAGRTAGREMTIAIAVDGERAVGYACDGKRVEAWLDGTLSGDRLSMTAKDGTTVEGTVTTGQVDGTLTTGDRDLAFTAESAAPPSGLYEGRADVRGVSARIGWIVLPDGSQVGAGKVGDTPVDAPELVLDGTTSLDGVPVTVTPVTGEAR
ncbi:MAG: hypothetical protein OJJ54_19060 [Pseudonocardia sp.]|nr:hypothetical protein [Pseudonocardia sp.]